MPKVPIETDHLIDYVYGVWNGKPYLSLYYETTLRGRYYEIVRFDDDREAAEAHNQCLTKIMLNIQEEQVKAGIVE